MNSFMETLKRFSKAWRYGWVAFLPPLGYGFLESSLNGSFPVYGLRIGIDVTSISILLTAFAIGGIVFQLPLGILSDKLGRSSILKIILFLGFISFTIASFLEHSVLALTICLFLSGMVVGSTFSLGISYMADLTPKNLLPTGNIMCGIAFSVGSLAGPYIGGIFIQFFTRVSFFLIISVILLLLFIAIAFFGDKTKTHLYKSA
jgi:MFS family permease